MPKLDQCSPHSIGDRYFPADVSELIKVSIFATDFQSAMVSRIAAGFARYLGRYLTAATFGIYGQDYRVHFTTTRGSVVSGQWSDYELPGTLKLWSAVAQGPTRHRRE